MLLQGTGAVELTQSDDVGQSIVLEPHPGPNGQYAYYDADGEIAVDLSASNPNVEGDGPNDDAVTEISDVFTVTNDGDATARVWIESEHPLVTFTVGGDSVEGPDQAVVLEPNESVAVGLHVVTTQDVRPDVVVDTFAVNAVIADDGGDDASDDGSDGDGAGEDERDDPVDDTDGTRTTVTAPAPNERRVTVQDLVGPVTVDLDGMHVAGANVTLDRVAFSRSTRGTVRFGLVGQPEPVGPLPELGDDRDARPDGYVHLDHELRPDAVSNVTVYVSVDRDYLDWRDTDPDEVTVYRLADGRWVELDARIVERDGRVHYAAESPELSSVVVASHQPRIVVESATVDDRRLRPGESTTVTADLVNDGRADGERTVAFGVDGESVATNSVELEPGETESIRESLPFAEPGEYDLTVGGVDAGTVVVEADATATVEDEPAGTEAREPAAPGTSDEPKLGDGPGLLALLLVVTGSTLLVLVGRQLIGY